MECFAVASLDDIDVESTLQGPQRPPADDSGTFNLTWPSCVEYLDIEDPEDNRLSESTASEVPKLKRKASIMSERSQTDNRKKVKAAAEDDNVEDNFLGHAPSFQYQSLLDRNDIRLLELQPGSDGVPLHADFGTANLNSGDDAYDALSYTWADDSGNTDRCRPLFVGPFWDVIPITRNCEQALNAVRPLTGKPRKIWVDSVCIDQDNHTERSSQVALMTQIYSAATEVLVYLGPARDNSDLALAAITRSFLHLGCGHVPPEKGNCETCSTAIGLLSQRPYFRRLWVVQEVVLSRQVSIYCGMSNVLWPHVALAGWLKFASWARHRDVRGGPRNDSDPPRDLVSLILDTSGCLCQDPRDRVFALLGLIKDWKGAPITPNYELSVNAVWIGLASYLVTNGRGQETLMLAGTYHDRRPGLPSWVPNMSQLPSVDGWFDTSSLNPVRDPKELSTTNSSLFSLSVETFDPNRSPCRLSIMPQSPPLIEINPRKASLHVSATRLCNVNECLIQQPLLDRGYSPHLVPKTTPGIRYNRALQAVICLPNIPTPLSSSWRDRPETVFSTDDYLYWLHGIEAYAILRYCSEPATFTMVSACDLIIGWERYYLDRRFSVKPFTAREESILAMQWDRIVRKLEIQVGAIHTDGLAARPARAQLLDIAQTLYPLTDGRDPWPRNNCGSDYRLAERIWSKWKLSESRILPLLRDIRGRRAIIRAFRRATDEKCSLPIENNNGWKTRGCGNVGCVRGLTHVSKLLWSLIPGSAPSAREDGPQETCWRGDESEDLARPFVEWAETTEQLLLRLQKSEECGAKALAQTMPHEGIGRLWTTRWDTFWENAFPLLGVSDADTVNAMERILDLYDGRSRVSDNGAHTSPKETGHVDDDVWTALSQESSWSWQEIGNALDAKFAIWKILDEDAWMRKWRTQGRSVQELYDLEAQLAIRLKMRRRGFDVDNKEEVIIL